MSDEPSEEQFGLFERMYDGASGIINLAQLAAAVDGDVHPGDVIGLLVSALGRYAALVEASSPPLTGEQIWDKSWEKGFKPMFVAMFDSQRVQMENSKEKKRGDHIQ